MPAASRSPDPAQLIAPPNRLTRVRERQSVPFEKGAANDDLEPRAPAAVPERHHGLMLSEMIRELVRSEVRTEVARVIAITPPQPTHVSVAEYAAARSISVSTVRNAIRGGRLPAIRIGTAVRVPIAAEIGRPVHADANGRDANPVMRAEQILTGRSERSSKFSSRRIAV